MLFTFVGITSCATSRALNQNEEAKREARSELADDREKMAGIHERFATCLRGSGTMESCHEEMKKDCKDIMGKDGCMMSGKMKHHGDHKKK